MDGLNWDMIQAVVTAVGSGFLVWASVSVRRIHKTNQNVQHHKIGKLTSREMDLLRIDVGETLKDGNVWQMKKSCFVRGSMLTYNAPDYDRGRKISSSRDTQIRDAFNVGEPLPISVYGDAMSRMLLYGLLAMAVSADGRQLRWVVVRTEYGAIEFIRQQGWDRRPWWKRLIRRQ